VAGFSFVEVLLATLIVGTLMVAATTALTSSVHTYNVLAGQPFTALTLAREIHAAALTLPRDPGDGVPATDGSEVVVLDDLDGALFSPPIDAQLATLAHVSGWSQDVALERVSLSQPDQPAALSADLSTLWRLDVVIRQGAKEVGRYSWWINP
jgi:hypothetical protein